MTDLSHATVEGYLLISEVSSPVEMEGNVVIFDDRSMIQIPEGSIMPKVKAGVCIC